MNTDEYQGQDQDNEHQHQPCQEKIKAKIITPNTPNNPNNPNNPNLQEKIKTKPLTAHPLFADKDNSINSYEVRGEGMDKDNSINLCEVRQGRGY